MPIRGSYGFKPSLPDQRDRVLRFTAAQRRATAASVDLRSTGYLPDVWDQGDLGACVPHGEGAAYAFDVAKQGGPPNFKPSMLFVYYCGRTLENTVNSDSGLTITDGTKSLNRWGCPPDSDWPYDISKFTQKPPPQAFADGASRQSVKYARVPGTVADMQACLTAGYPIVIGFTVYESFESAAVAATGVVPMPGQGESVLGGHCVLAVGYQPDGTWICRNSWGVDWGIDGYFTFPQQYLTNPNLASDFWTVQQVESPDPTPTPPQPSPTPAPDPMDAALITAADPWADSRNVWSKFTKAGKAREGYDTWKTAKQYN